MGRAKLASLIAGLLFVLSLEGAAGAAGAAAKGSVLVFKDEEGQIIRPGAEVTMNATNVVAKTRVTVAGKKYKETGSCKNIRTGAEVKKTENTYVVKVGTGGLSYNDCGPDFGKNFSWFGEMEVTPRYFWFTAPDSVKDQTYVLWESGAAETEKEEGLMPRGPLLCSYGANTGQGTFRLGRPLVLKLHGTAGPLPTNPAEGGRYYPGDEEGCASTTKWSGTFELHVVPVLEEPPSVSGVSPDEGPEAGGTTVTITGKHFPSFGTCAEPEPEEEFSVYFGTARIKECESGTSTSLTAVSAPGNGTVNVQVETLVGKTAISPADQFTYRPPPTVTEVNPKLGPESGGTEVTIKGTNFMPNSTVMFGTTAATSVTVNSESSITATSPKGSGTVKVVVTTAGGPSTASGSSNEFTYIPLA